MLRRVPYDPERPLVVRRPFDGYRIGDTFDASRCNFRRTAQLYNSAYIIHSDGPRAVPVVDAIREECVKPEVEVVELVEEVLPATTPVAVVVPEPTADTLDVEFEDTGAGWYNVKVDGYTVSDKKLRGLEAAQQWAKENGFV